MPVQRIKPIERHFEKLLVGISAAGLLGVVAWQVAGSKNSVNVDKAKDLALSDAYPKLQSMAEALRAELTSTDAVKKVPPAPPVNLKEQFLAKAGKGVSPAESLAWVPASIRIPGIDDKGTTAGPVASHTFVPQLPAPGQPEAAAFVATIDKSEVDLIASQNPEAAKMFAKGAPYDMAAVSVEAEFSGTELKTALENDPDGKDGPIRPLPRQWWQGTSVLAVQLVREQKMPDGSWGERTVLPPMPGRLSLVPMLGNANLETVQQLAQQANERQEEILRPTFYRHAEMLGMPVGEEWVAPSEAKVRIDSPGSGETASLQNKIAGYDREIKKLAANIEKQEQARQSRPTSGGGIGPGGGGGARGTGGAGGPGGTGASGQTVLDAQIAESKAKLKKLQEQRAAAAQKLADLGGKVAPIDLTKPVVDDRDLSPLLLEKKLKLYAHDVTAARGATYRYQMRLLVNNPLMGKASNLIEKDAEIAKLPTLATPDSPWTEEVKVPAETYVVIAGARAGDNAVVTKGPTVSQNAAATAIVYTFTCGYWRAGRVQLEPGDPFMAMVTVPDAAKIATIVLDPNAPTGALPGQPTPPPGKGVMPPPGSLTPPGQPTGAQPKEKSALPLNIPTKKVLVSRDGFLLDVSTLPEGGANKAQVLLRDSDGRVVVRTPEADAADKFFRALEASAKQGEAQLAQKIGETPGSGGNKPAPGVPNPPISNQPPPPGGGGGGGGGAGGG